MTQKKRKFSLSGPKGLSSTKNSAIKSRIGEIRQILGTIWASPVAAWQRHWTFANPRISKCKNRAFLRIFPQASRWTTRVCTYWTTIFNRLPWATSGNCTCRDLIWLPVMWRAEIRTNSSIIRSARILVNFKNPRHLRLPGPTILQQISLQDSVNFTRLAITERSWTTFYFTKVGSIRRSKYEVRESTCRRSRQP